MAEHLFSLPTTMANEVQAAPPEQAAPLDDCPTQSFMELIDPSVASSTSNNNNNGQAAELTKSELAQSQEKAIKTLLDKCAQNNVS
jgi:hypothetical protein